MLLGHALACSCCVENHVWVVYEQYEPTLSVIAVNLSLRASVNNFLAKAASLSSEHHNGVEFEAENLESVGMTK